MGKHDLKEPEYFKNAQRAFKRFFKRRKAHKTSLGHFLDLLCPNQDMVTTSEEMGSAHLCT
ncbi:hypothetical protein CHCC14813_3832 [Bacillus licheniformis]|nr:hypothetical protein CHCC14813_3832 [Bacillus licheniformis]